ncbi:MAG: Elongation factor Ts [Chlamydiia bacterium]|nr:Elongation factor Ts [Chlamydiia bacterium]
MSTVTPDKIKSVREITGVGMGKCVEALKESGGDVEQAVIALRKQGIASAAKKESREANEGQVKALEGDGAVVVIELNAETDFVVRNDKFQQFHDEILKEFLDSSADELEAFLSAPSKANSEMTIDDRRKEVVSVLSENIQIPRVKKFAKNEDTSFGVYSHMGGKICCVVRIDGASDQQGLARDIAMHVAAEAPEYIDADSVPADVIEREKDVGRSQVQGKPENIVEKIVEGKVRAFCEQVCLLSQKYVRDPSMTIQQLIEKASKESGKKLSLGAFIRWQTGGSN